MHVPAGKVGEANAQARAENCVASPDELAHVNRGFPGRRLWSRDLRLHDNSHDDAIDGHGLTENDAAEIERIVTHVAKHKLNGFMEHLRDLPDEILRANAGSLNGSTHKRCSGQEDAPEQKSCRLLVHLLKQRTQSGR